MSPRADFSCRVSSVDTSGGERRRGGLEVEVYDREILVTLYDDYGELLVEQFTAASLRRFSAALIRAALLVEGRS